MGKKVPKPKFSDCLDSTSKNPPQIEGGQFKCRGHRCVAKCNQGLLLTGGKKIECRADRNKKLYLQPATMPKCVTCQPLEDLVDFDDYVVHTKKRRKGNLYTMSCQNENNILPFNKFYLAAQICAVKRPWTRPSPTRKCRPLHLDQRGLHPVSHVTIRIGLLEASKPSNTAGPGLCNSSTARPVLAQKVATLAPGRSFTRISLSPL